MELDIQQLIRLMRRWWWLLLLAPIVAGITTRYIDSRRADEARLYTATSIVLVFPVEGEGRPSYTLSTYVSLLRSRAVVEPVIATLALPFDVDDVNEMITIVAPRDPGAPDDAADLLTLDVTDTEPARAADIANAIVAEFQRFVAYQAVQLSAPSRDAITTQIEDVERRIADLETQIQTLEQTSNADDPDIRTVIDSLRLTLAELRASEAELIATARLQDLSIAAAPNQVSVVDPAVTPAEPDPAPREIPIVPLAAIAGFLIAGAIAMILEYLDTTVKASSDFVALTGAPLLGVIARMPRLRGANKRLFILTRPDSPQAEAIRRLRANIEIASASGEVMSVAIAGAGQGEGKSTVAANLAVALAKSGLRTVLIDADLRHPSQHAIFGVGNSHGLTTLLTDQEVAWQLVTADVAVPNLVLIASGPLPDNPADLLRRDRIRDLLAEIGEWANVIVVDTPALLRVSDPLVVATAAGAAILVCQASRTRLEGLGYAAASLRQGGVDILGVVVNQQRGRADGSYPLDPRGYGRKSRPAGKPAAATTNGRPVPETDADEGEVPSLRPAKRP